jgi:hypothetical protein
VYYSHEPLPAPFPFPGLSSGEQLAELSMLWGILWLAQRGGSSPIDIGRNCVIFDNILQLIRQDQNIEYLAANLEAGTVRTGWEGVQPTAEVLSWYHHRGIVTMWDENELRKQAETSQWARDTLKAQGEARGYWNDLVSWMMPEARMWLSH